MYRYILVCLLSLNILFANDEVNKPSELEVFLFKIGFEALLKDVDINKQKSNLNEQEIKALKNKVNLIIDEMYKRKNTLDEKSNTNYENKDELESLKKEISLLKEQVRTLKSDQKPKIEVKKDIINPNIKSNQVKHNGVKLRIATDFLHVYTTSSTTSKVINNLVRDRIIEVSFCKSGWCKLKNQKGFIREFLTKRNE